MYLQILILLINNQTYQIDSKRKNINSKLALNSISLSRVRLPLLSSASIHQSSCHFLAVDLGKMASSTLHPQRNSKVINLRHAKRIIYTY